MKNGIKMNVFNSQDVIVFNEYKFYENEAAFENDDQNLVDKKLLINNSPFNMDKYFHMNPMYIENDIKSWLEFEGLSLEELYNKMFSFETDKAVDKDNIKYKSMITRFSEKEDDFKTYPLRDITGIYTELAKVEPFNTEDIQRFIHIFGLPTGLRETPNMDIGLNAYPVTAVSVNYTELNSQLMKYKAIYETFKDIMTKNVEVIKQNHLADLDIMIEFNPDLSPIFELQRAFYLEESDEAIFEETKSEFIELVNVQNFYEGIIGYKNKTYVMESFFKNLFEYSYFQMSQALINDSEFKKCKNCNHFFEVSPDNPDFCPSLPFSDVSQCKIEFEQK